MTNSIWVFPVTFENWIIARNQRIWAVRTENIARKVGKDDFVILYVIGTDSFCTIIQILEDWTQARQVAWGDEIKEDRMVNTMKNLDLIDTRVKSDTAKGYLYIIEICKRLYSEIFNKKIEEHKSRFGFKIDQDFSLIVIHEFFWEYDEFQSYDITKLEEATGDTWQDLEAQTDWNLAVLENLM